MLLHPQAARAGAPLKHRVDRAVAVDDHVKVAVGATAGIVLAAVSVAAVEVMKFSAVPLCTEVTAGDFSKEQGACDRLVQV